MSRPTAPQLSLRLRASGGFTLVELLMAIALATMFGGALYSTLFSGMNAARTHQIQAEAQAKLRTAVDRFSRDLRQAVSPDGDSTPPIASLTTTVVILYSDPDRDPADLTPRPYRIRYSVVGGELLRESAAPVGSVPPYSYGSYGTPETLVDGLQNGSTPVFRAFTEQGLQLATPVAQPRDIKSVRFALVVGQKTGEKATTTELSADVTLRNAVRL